MNKENMITYPKIEREHNKKKKKKKDSIDYISSVKIKFIIYYYVYIDVFLLHFIIV